MESTGRSDSPFRCHEGDEAVSSDLDRLRLLSLAAREQRARLRARLGATRSRLTPARLKNDARITAEAAITDAARNLGDSVKRHPLAAGLAVVGALAWAFRDPLLARGPAWLKDAYDRLAGHLPLSQNEADFDHTGDEAANGDIESAENDNDGTDETVPQKEEPPRHD